MKKYNKKQVLCLGSYFTENYGDHAIFSVIEKALKSKGGIRALPFSIKPTFAYRHGTSMRLISKIVMGIFILPKHYLSMYKKAKDSSAVLIGGGNLIHDVYPLTVVQFFLTCLTIKAAGRKSLIFAVGVGPLRSWFSRLWISLSCKLSEGIVIRDTYSKRVIERCWGIKNRLREIIVPDVVLSIEAKEEKVLNKEQPLVGISTMFYKMPEKYPGGRKQDYQNYLKRMEDIVRLTVKRLKAKVIIFSTEPTEDQATVNELMARVQDLKDVSSVEIKSLALGLEVTGSCDYHIGSRLHTLIFSLAQGVPSVALTSHGRITGLFTDLDAKDLMHNIDDFNPASVVESVEKLMGDRGKNLIENVDNLRKRSQRGISNMVMEISSF